MTTEFTRRQFFGISALAGLSLFAKPCWELPLNNPHWCPPPSPVPPSPTRSHGLLLLF